MGYFDFTRPVYGNLIDRRNSPWLPHGNAALGSVKPLMALAQTGSGMGGNFSQDRFNPQKDRIEEGSIVEDWIPRQPTNLHLLCRRIYLRDAIGGSVVDIFSTLPWGKVFELMGLDDPKVLQMYQDMIESLGVWGELPMISRELLIIGRMIGSLNFNERSGLWDSMVPIDPDQAKIISLPMSGHKPLVDVLSSPAWREFARSTDPRVVELKEKMNKNLLEMLQNHSGYLPLDPMNTLFVARRVNQYDHIGTSLYTRLMPAWAYEMALWNASLTGVRRRNRSLMLVTAGIEDNWEPNDQELQNLTSLFMQANEDPTGAIIAVRQGVEVAEVGDPTAIWGISQEFEFLSTLKMRALGVSEAYLSGDANVSNMETARTSLGKAVTAFRDYLLREIFARQLFPTFARIHNFQKRSQAELSHRIRMAPDGSLARLREYDRRMRESDRLTPFGYPAITAKQALDIPLESLLVPRLITEDTLRPEQDTAYVELLEKLADKGVPIPLRVWASSAGYDLDKAMAMMEEDIVLRKRLAQLGQQMGGEGGEGGGGGAADLFKDTGGGGGAPGGGEEAGGPRRPGEAGPTLPPKWAFTGAGTLDEVRPFPTFSSTGTRFEEGQIENALKYFREAQNPYVRSLTKIDPKILANLQMEPSVGAGQQVLAPYVPPEPELK